MITPHTQTFPQNFETAVIQEMLVFMIKTFDVFTYHLSKNYYGRSHTS